MSYYGILYPSFWHGDTGRLVADEGGMAAQLVAAYLTSCQAATMIGLYQVRIDDIARGIRTVNERDVESALAVLGNPTIGFADYDKRSGFVWVREMAAFRLGCKHGPLDPRDKRIDGANNKYAQVKPNPFLSQFFDRYRLDLHLTKRRRSEGVIDPPIATPSKGAQKGLRRGSRGAGKPVNRTDQLTEQISTEDQGGGADQSAADAACPPLSFIDFSALFNDGHKARTGVDAIIKKRDEEKIAPHLAIGQVVLQRCLDAFFQTADPYIIRVGFTVTVFVGQLGSLIAQTSEVDAARFRAEFPHGLGPGWQDDCIRLHGGACPSAFVHWQKSHAVPA